MACPALPPDCSGAPLVGLGLFVVLSGCIGPIGPGSPTATRYPAETVPFPDGPKDRPSKPDTFTSDTAREFVVAHEFRYSHNELWEPGADVGLSESSCSVESATPEGDGFVVTVRCVGYVNYGGTATESTAVHHDLAPWTVRYYVDEDSVLRTERS